MDRENIKSVNPFKALAILFKAEEEEKIDEETNKIFRETIQKLDEEAKKLNYAGGTKGKARPSGKVKRRTEQMENTQTRYTKSGRGKEEKDREIGE